MFVLRETLETHRGSCARMRAVVAGKELGALTSGQSMIVVIVDVAVRMGRNGRRRHVGLFYFGNSLKRKI